MTETIHLFAICHNEEVLLPHFIQHYKTIGVTKFTFYDNFSTDRSREIMKANHCEIIDYDSGGQIRDDLYLSIKNNCWKKANSQWVIVCDVDEFLHLDGITDFHKYGIIYSKGYDILGMPPSNIGLPNNLYSKTVMFRPNLITEINYNFGAHICRPTSPAPVIGSMKFATLFHYSHIDENYVYNRKQYFHKRISDFNKQMGFGTQYILPPTLSEVCNSFNRLNLFGKEIKV